MAKYWGTPTFFIVDFKHNFSQCNILSRETPPPNVTFVKFFLFLKASLTFENFFEHKVQPIKRSRVL